ncbi:MAG: phosphoribosylglycinamide formyltransferase [Planctomycetes bacterium DG_58]|nr:MAG: phosphoribosylglycinamide formyltransferase [Planctomycetes bacterium DG_58]KPL01515.1 MAG: phosphoribosylglycinamide formyltransferase [Planctomycetes bacterium SM23_65]
MTDPIKLGVMISGGGTTLQNFLDKIETGELLASVAVVISSSRKAYGLERAKKHNISTYIVRRRDYETLEAFSKANFDILRRYEVDLVCLAGYLKLLRIPEDFDGRVMNIHPALIPSFCGDGFYGHTVHQTVLDYGVKVSGCTVHFVNNEYDNGPVIVQRTCPVFNDDDADTLARRVFREECIAYPQAIRLFQAGRLKIDGRHVRLRRD